MNSVSVIVVHWVHDICRQTPRPPQAAGSNINKCTADQQWSYASVHPSNTHTCTNWNSLKERERKYSVIQKKRIYSDCYSFDAQLALDPKVGKASLFLNFVFAITRTEKQNKKTGHHPFPPAPSPTDVFHQHSLSITETFAEITLETLASCCFDPIRDILVYFFFFAISYQSTKQPCDLPLFKQLTSLAAKEPAGAGHANSSSIFEREKHHCVLHNFTQTSLPIQHMPVRPSVQHVLSGSCHISISIYICINIFKIIIQDFVF